MRPSISTTTALIAAAAALCALPASAALYKWVDASGRTVYSDQPPANVDSKQLRIQSAPPAAAPAPAKSALEKAKELDKGRKDASEKAKKAEQEAKRTAENEERCANARHNLKVAETARRPFQSLLGDLETALKRLRMWRSEGERGKCATAAKAER